MLEGGGGGFWPDIPKKAFETVNSGHTNIDIFK